MHFVSQQAEHRAQRNQPDAAAPPLLCQSSAHAALSQISALQVGTRSRAAMTGASIFLGVLERARRSTTSAARETHRVSMNAILASARMAARGAIIGAEA